jgi:hypothetical protein
MPMGQDLGMIGAASFPSSEPWGFKSGSDHGTVTDRREPCFYRAYLRRVRQGSNGSSGPGACELRQARGAAWGQVAWGVRRKIS